MPETDGTLHIVIRQNSRMRMSIFLFMLAVNGAFAADSAPIYQAASRHAHLLAAGQEGRTEITTGPLDTSRLPECTRLESYTPPGSRPIGRTHVGVRCLAPHPWSILVPVRIAVIGTYLATARALVAGQAIQAGDLQTLTGDIAALPAGTLTDPARAIGKTMRYSLGPGQTLRRNQIQAPFVVRQGQRVRVVTRGSGFVASAEGTALNNAAEGDVARVRTDNRQTLSGTAQPDGTIEVGN